MGVQWRLNPLVILPVPTPRPQNPTPLQSVSPSARKEEGPRGLRGERAEFQTFRPAPFNPKLLKVLPPPLHPATSGEGEGRSRWGTEIGALGIRDLALGSGSFGGGDRKIFSKGRGWGLGRRRLGQEEMGPALGGARVGTEKGSHRCSIEAARTCRRGRRRPGRAPPSPRHSHRRPPRPQPGPGPPPPGPASRCHSNALRSSIPGSARPASGGRRRAWHRGHPPGCQERGVGTPLARPPPPTQFLNRDWLSLDPPRYRLVPPTTGAYSP